MAETITDPLAREVMRTLVEAAGPLTAREVCERTAERHAGALPLAPVSHRLLHLCRRELVESRADVFPGHRPSRLFWPAR